MKIKVNRNILWSETFINKLSSLGVKYACLSPGSRNTPLTIALANNSQIKSFVLIDERSSGFFALGLARATDSPVVLVCTSGTAVAEYYPAIIEAFQQRIPLIVCTADRPPELIGKGANQTIFQDNIYRNHIRWFLNAGLPDPSLEKLEFICRAAEKAVTESTKVNRGPVHINFPFRKPFEPFSFTDEIEDNLKDVSNCLRNQIFRNSNQGNEMKHSQKQEKLFEEIFEQMRNNRKGLIVAGPGSYTDSFSEKSNLLASVLNFPVIADAASQLRFNHKAKTNLLSNFEGYIRSDEFRKNAEPEIIIQFGRISTSKAMEQFLENTNAPCYVINEFGEWHDPFNKAKAVLEMSPESFCEKVLMRLRQDNFSLPLQNEWLTKFIKADCLAEELRREIIEGAPFPFEGRIITEILNLMPDSSVLMVSNSMPVRDLDYFAPKMDKSVRIFHNRGASGIDGISSTALGISQALQENTVLITGDLAFYYDLNGLLAAKKYSIPLIIVLINNNGGGIFEMLPVSKCENVFNEYFITPHNLDFSHFVKGYDGHFEQAESWEHFRSLFSAALERKMLSVIQLNTDAAASASLRREYWKRVEKRIL